LTEGVAQALERPFCKLKSLSSNPSPIKKKFLPPYSCQHWLLCLLFTYLFIFDHSHSDWGDRVICNLNNSMDLLVICTSFIEKHLLSLFPMYWLDYSFLCLKFLSFLYILQFNLLSHDQLEEIFLPFCRLSRHSSNCFLSDKPLAKVARRERRPKLIKLSW
jgi:hypothetical protein